jgi:hypothetical protein
MGWLSTLAKVGLGVAAPFTGGASLMGIPAVDAIGKMAGGVGSVAGGAAGAKSDQRMQETALTNQFNQTDLAKYQAQQAAQNQAGQLDLQRKSFTEDARGGRAKQALLADLLSNMQDVNINVPGVQTANVSGGLRPSAIGATGRSSLAELAKQALAAQMSGDQFTGGQVLDAPTLRGMPQAGKTEKGLDWIGLLGSVAGAISGLTQNKGSGGGSGVYTGF